MYEEAEINAVLQSHVSFEKSFRKTVENQH